MSKFGVDKRTSGLLQDVNKFAKNDDVQQYFKDMGSIGRPNEANSEFVKSFKDNYVNRHAGADAGRRVGSGGAGYASLNENPEPTSGTVLAGGGLVKDQPVDQTPQQALISSLQQKQAVNSGAPTPKEKVLGA